MKPEDLKVLIVVNDKTVDQFLSFLFNQGYTWIEKDFEGVKKDLDKIGTLLINVNDPLLDKVIRKMESMSWIFVWSIGYNHIFYKIDIFNHFLYNMQYEWKLFSETYKSIHGTSYNQLLNTINDL
jgi:hypothetical protein